MPWLIGNDNDGQPAEFVEAAQKQILSNFRAGLFSVSAGNRVGGIRKALPSREKIVRHWQACSAKIAVEWEFAGTHCWACGTTPAEPSPRLTRCHCIPHSIGGPATCENLVLLCEQCHAGAPSVADPRWMWEYIERGGEGGTRWVSLVGLAMAQLAALFDELLAAGESWYGIGKRCGTIIAGEVGLAPCYGFDASPNLPYIYERLRATAND